MAITAVIEHGSLIMFATWHQLGNNLQVTPQWMGMYVYQQNIDYYFVFLCISPIPWINKCENLIVKKEWERWSNECYSACEQQTLQYFIGHLLQYGIQEWRTCLVVTNHFPVNYGLYETQLLGSLDASRCSVLFYIPPNSLSFDSIIYKTGFYLETNKEKDKFHVFEVEQFQTPAILLQVLTFSVLLAVLKNAW